MVARGSLEPYVPRLVVNWLREDPQAIWREVEGTLVFVDISGFTQLTERLARKGKVGAEEMSDVLNATFGELLSVAYVDGAGLVKWGGDAVLLLFEGDQHAARATRAAYRMRARLRKVGDLRTTAGRVRLRMSVGVHSGTFQFFLVGDPAIHRELIVSGPAASRTAEMEGIAEAGEIRLSPESAALLPALLTGNPREQAFLLMGEPMLPEPGPIPRPPGAGLDLASMLPRGIREHLLGAAGEPEHRHVAVAFVQFSGSDAVFARDGAAGLARAMDGLVRVVQQATLRHGVTFFESDINRDGGKIMLTAGAPVSADDDEERMLRTARTVVERAEILDVRVGVNTGSVFAGDFGPEFRRTFSVKGDAINLAARVTGKARVGEVVATEAALARSRTRFAVEPLEPFAVKGKSMLIEASVVGPPLTEREEPADAVEGPLVGREAELGLLRGALDRALGGAGLVVDLAGDPGIGKTRLVRELVRDVPATAYRTRCDKYETATAYWAFRILLRQMLGVADDAADDAVVEVLRATTEDVRPRLLPWLPLVAQVLDVEVAPTVEVTALAERFRKARLEDVTAELLAALLQGPTVLAFEDAHLMDAASADLLEAVLRVVGAHPWLVLVTRRDADGGFLPSDRYEVLPVRPAALDTAAAAALAAELLGDQALAPHDLARLTERAGGNPLFLRGLLLAARTGAALDALPDSLEGLITSQIDRLPADERTVLRFASVLGMRFGEAELLSLLAGQSLPSGANSLRRLGYFLSSESPGRFRFDHQLIRDTAYEGLPYRLRRMLHGRAGEWLEAEYVSVEDVAELLSLHFLGAERFDKAWTYSRLAGRRASAKYAPAQAEQFLVRALAASKRLPELPRSEVAEVTLELGEARFLIGRQPESLAAFRAARRMAAGDPLAEALIRKREAEVEMRRGRLTMSVRSLGRALRALDGRTDTESLVVASRIEGLFARVREGQGRYREALTWARRAEDHAQESRDPAAIADALEALHATLSLLAIPPERPYGEEAVALFAELGDKVGESRALNNLAVLAWIEGRGDEALEMFVRAEALAESVGDTVGAAATRYNIGDVLLRLGRPQEAEDLLRPLVPLLRSLGVEDFHAAAMRALGLALALGGRDADGRAMLAEARVHLDALGEAPEVVETDAAIALALLAAGESAQAAELAAAAAARATELDAGYLLPWLLRLEGAGLADLGQLEEAERILLEALALADAQSRIERGFVLAELARVAAARADAAGAQTYVSASEAAFTELGFVGSRRYPRA